MEALLLGIHFGSSTLYLYMRESSLVTLRNLLIKLAFKGGSAKQVVKGLSSSGENYAEAIDCLQKRYDRPRLIHQAHV